MTLLTKNHFQKNFSASAEITDLEALGWDFTEYYQNNAEYYDISFDQSKEQVQAFYFVRLHVNEYGATFFELLNYESRDSSHYEETGDDDKTIEDLMTLYQEDGLWDVQFEPIKSTDEQKLEYLHGLKTSHIQFSDYFTKPEHVADLYDFDDVFDYLQDCGAVEVEIIYYYESMKYLIEYDTSLQESLELANDFGYALEDLNSEVLASLHASEAHRAELHELAQEINNTFADIDG